MGLLKNSFLKNNVQNPEPFQGQSGPQHRKDLPASHHAHFGKKTGSFAILLAKNMQIDLFRPLAGSVFCSERLHQSKIHDFAAVPQPFSLKINFQ